MKSQILAAWRAQIVLSMMFLAVVLLWQSSLVFSAFVGVLAALAPNGYVAWKMVKQAQNNNATQWLGHAYRSQFGKWIMTGVIFALAFTADVNWDYRALLAGFVFVQLTNWLLPLIVRDW